MIKEVYYFKLIMVEGDKPVEVGGTIYAPNGRKGKIVEIKSVRFDKRKNILVKGKAELELS